MYPEISAELLPPLIPAMEGSVASRRLAREVSKMRDEPIAGLTLLSTSEDLSEWKLKIEGAAGTTVKNLVQQARTAMHSNTIAVRDNRPADYGDRGLKFRMVSDIVNNPHTLPLCLRRTKVQFMLGNATHFK